MRTWDYWERHRQAGESIDAADYEAIGTLRQALSLHAEEAYQEAAGSRGGMIAERMFKALTDTFSDPRGVRSPTPVHELAEISEASEVEVIEYLWVAQLPVPAVTSEPKTRPDAEQRARVRDAPQQWGQHPVCPLEWRGERLYRSVGRRECID